MRFWRALTLWIWIALAAPIALAFTALQVTNNSDLVVSPRMFWSRTFAFADEFEQVVPTDTLRIAGATCVLVRGREVSFYVPRIMANVAATLSPGDRIQAVGEMKSVPGHGLVIAALEFRVDTWTVRATAGENGSIEPSGFVKVPAGEDAAFTVRAARYCRIASVTVDGQPAGTFGPASDVFTYEFSAVTNHHSISATFVRDTWSLTIGSEREGAVPPPGTHVYEAGTEIEASVEKPEARASVPGTRYVCRGWMGSGSVPAIGTDTVVRFTITKDSDILWNWGTEYWLQMGKPTGGTVKPAAGWFLTGEEIRLEAQPKAGSRFDRWTGDIPAGSERENPVAVTMDRPRAIDAKFERDVQIITATAEADGRIEPSGDVEVQTGDGAQFAITALPGHHISSVLVDGRPARSFGPGDTSFTYSFALVNDHHAIEAAFEKERFTLTVQSERGAPQPAAGAHAYDAGETVEAHLGGAPTEPALDGARYTCRGWEGTGNAPASGTGTTVRFTILKDSCVTWLWDTQYRLKVAGGEGGSVQHGETWHAKGTAVTLKAAPDDGFQFAGWTGDVPVDLERRNPITLVMDRPRSVVATFERERFTLTVQSERGAPQPAAGSHEYAAGEPVEARLGGGPAESARDGARFVCRGWTGTGSAPASGTGTTVRFEIREDSSVTWLWGSEYRLKVAGGEGGSVERGETWHPESAEVTRTATPDDGFQFARWTGDVAADREQDNPVTLLMDRPRSIAAVFARGAYTITARAGEHGKIQPSGNVKVPAGDRASFSITAAPGYHIASVAVDGQPAGDFGQGDTSFKYAFTAVAEPHTLEAAFARDQSRLTVKSEHGTPSPPTGTHAIEAGTAVEAGLEQAVVEAGQDGARLVCRGWKGAGDVPSKGTGTTARFTITRDSTLTWLWGTEYRLQVNAEEGGSAERGETWHPEGATVSVKATPDNGFQFARWTGDVPAGSEQRASISLAMDRPRSVTALFARGTRRVTVRAVGNGQVDPSGDLDIPAGGSASFTVRADAEHHIASVRVDGKNVGQFEQGDIAFKYSLSAVNEPHTLEASFARDQYRLTVNAERGRPAPPAGSHLLDAGMDVEARLEKPSGEGGRDGVRYVAQGWKGTGDVPPKGTGTSVRFTLRRDSSLTWLWGKEYLLKAGGGAGGAVAEAETWCPEGQTATLKATPEGGYVFVRWSGDVPSGDEANNPLTLVMKHPRTVMALFEREPEPTPAPQPTPPPAPRKRERKPEPALEPEPSPVAVAAPESAPAPAPEPELTVPAPQPTPEVAPKPEPMPEVAPAPVPAPQEEPIPAPQPPPEPAPAPSAPVQEATPAPEPEPEQTLIELPGPGPEPTPVAPREPEPAAAPTPEAAPTAPEREVQMASLARPELEETGEELIEMPGPRLSVSTTEVFLEAHEDEIGSNVSFEVWNSGRGILKYVVVRNVPWLSLTPKLGWSTGEHDRIQMEYRTPGLPPGSYSATVTVAARGSDAAPCNIEVGLTVREDPEAGRPVGDPASAEPADSP